MDKKRSLTVQLIRHAIQVAAFLLLPGLFILVFSAVRDIVMAAVAGTFSFGELYPQVLLAGGVLLVTALMGRFFCGYLCSFGMFQELLHLFRKRRGALKQRLPAKVDHALKYVKYVVLVLIVVCVWVLQLPVDSSWSPWGVFGALVSGNLQAAVGAVPTIGFALLVAIAVGSVFVEHFFCRYLCPLGAMFAGVSRLKLCRVQRQSKTCTNCGLCSRVCGMDIDIPSRDAVASGECIQCLECLPACPQGSLTENPSAAVAGVAAAAAIGGAVVFGSTVSQAADSDVPVQATAAEYDAVSADRGAYQDGVYAGSGRGFRGTVDVEVTVENGHIADITVLSYGDDRQFFQQAQPQVISQILATQQPDVQAVSGATYSSRGIMDAVADALGGAVELPKAPADDSRAEADKFGAAAAQIPRSQASEEETAPEVPAADEQASGSSTFSLEDGIYEGSGSGFRGTTQAAVTVEAGRIADITVLSYADDAPYFRRAQDTVISEILQSQSVDVQAVSGATYSSRGIMEAVANALGVEFTQTAPAGPGNGQHGRGKHTWRG